MLWKMWETQGSRKKKVDPPKPKPGLTSKSTSWLLKHHETEMGLLTPKPRDRHTHTTPPTSAGSTTFCQ